MEATYTAPLAEAGEAVLPVAPLCQTTAPVPAFKASTPLPAPTYTTPFATAGDQKNPHPDYFKAVLAAGFSA